MGCHGRVARLSPCHGCGEPTRCGREARVAGAVRVPRTRCALAGCVRPNGSDTVPLQTGSHLVARISRRGLVAWRHGRRRESRILQTCRLHPTERCGVVRTSPERNPGAGQLPLCAHGRFSNLEVGRGVRGSHGGSWSLTGTRARATRTAELHLRRCEWPLSGVRVAPLR